MLTLAAKIREITGKKVKALRGKEILPAVLYGPKIKNINLEINFNDFERVFKEAGESSAIKIEIEGGSKKDYSVLIHDIERNPIDGKPIHIDFLVPSATEEIIVKVLIVIEGEAPAVKELGATLIKDIHELEIKGLLQNLPKEIKVDVSSLKNFDDHITVGELNLPQGVKVLKDAKEIVVSATAPEKVEEELAKPVEEKVEEVEVVGKEKKEEEVEEAGMGKAKTEKAK